MARSLVLLFKEGDKETLSPTIRGGKGSGLAEMARLGVPVPPGFTVTTTVARAFCQEGRLPRRLAWQLSRGISALGHETGRGFGDAKNPLLVSVRSGAAVSMPGTVWGVIDSADSTGGDDADWYSVRLNAGSTYRVDLSSDSNLDGMLTLYGTDGTSWLAGADAGYQGGSEYFYYSPTATGDYYIAVDGWSNTTGEFWLSVAQTSGSSATTDTVGQTIGNSGSVAVSSTAPGHVNGAIDNGTDADWYAVTLAANTQYEFNLGSFSLDGILQLVLAAGRELDPRQQLEIGRAHV